MKAFISYTSSDKDFVHDLANNLQDHGIQVWYDEWEIKVGDSIVDKVFSGLDKSDALIVVLSNESIKSKWVKEELNAGLIRKIDDGDILLLPALKEKSNIPLPLRQIRYADFSVNSEAGLFQLLDRLQPLRTLWQALSLHKEHHALLVEKINNSDLEEDVSKEVIRLQELMSSATDIRCQIEMRLAKEKYEHRDLFNNIEKLAERGIDVRSLTWNSLLHYRAMIAHRSNNVTGALRVLAYEFNHRYKSEDIRDDINRALLRLSELMDDICTQKIPLDR